MEIITLILALLLAVFTPVSAQSSAVSTAPATAVAPVVVAATPIADANQSEIFITLDYGRGVFEPNRWRVSAEEQDTRTTVTWRADSIGALVHLEYLHFDDMASDFSLDNYIEGDYFDIIFTNYDRFKPLTECETDGLRLYEFSGRIGKSDYIMRYWAMIATPERVLTVDMVFPTGREDDLDQYARAMFPSLTSCEASG